MNFRFLLNYIYLNENGAKWHRDFIRFGQTVIQIAMLHFLLIYSTENEANWDSDLIAFEQIVIFRESVFSQKEVDRCQSNTGAEGACFVLKVATRQGPFK